MKTILQIKTPDANQYIELRSLQPLSPGTNNGSYVGFSEIRLVRPERTLRWLIDDWVPVELNGPYQTQQSIAQPIYPAKPGYLDKNGYLEFKFHLTSPVIPRTNGLWVRLDVHFDDGGLFLKGAEAQSWIGNGWTPLAESFPDWLRGEHAPWVIERVTNTLGARHLSLSAGNRLLSAHWDKGGPQCGNLVDIDPDFTGQQRDDFIFSLVPTPSTVDGKRMYDISTELVVSPYFGAPAAVNAYALLLADRVRETAPLGARGLHLRCQLQENAQYVPSGWTMHWLDVPGQSDPQAGYLLTLETFTEAHLCAHAYGLATVRARNRLSIVPTWMRTVDPKSVCKLIFDLKRKDFDVADVRLRDVAIDESVDLLVTCGGAVGLDGVTPWELTVRATQLDRKDVDTRSFLNWHFARIDVHPNAHQIGVGSVLLSLDQFAEGQLTLGSSPEYPETCSQNGGPYRRPALETSLSLKFSEARYGPLSMDPEIGFETLSAVVERPRPWTLDLDLEPRGSCPAELSEVAKHDQSRLLHVALNAPKAGEITTDVLLVDPCPLTVVRVYSTETIEGRDIIAEYIDDSDQAPEWRFYTEQGEMRAVLPPQGIGEEMIKGYLFLDPGHPASALPPPDELFDFRLTPVAKLMLDRTDIEMARTEAPWSLRRLLGQRPGVTGMKLESARFELLYGLQAQVETPGLRIAELDGLVGRVPYADALRRKKARFDQGARELEECYADAVSQWQSGLWNRPSWWRVFRDAAQRQTLTVDSGMQYLLRPTRQTANPFRYGDFATKPDAISSTWPRKALRGGVDWPFQSRNIYQELQNAPVSDTGSIEGLAFGALGGEGSQTAAFNHGKTLIISSSRQGRLDSLTVIRVGRISMLWNKARHVIVYERTTRRAPRYDYDEKTPPTGDDLEKQPHWDGFAAVRKVREYIEISQPKRRYPDSATERPVAGPLVQSVFGSTVIPVMSSWGHDILNGFVIALRGPIPPGKEQYFPDPQVFLDFARPDDKGGGAVSQRIVSTDRLVFFSSTRDDDGGDTDQWPAWPGIDFPPVKPSSAPKVPFRSSFTGLRQPDAQPVEFGMEPYTLMLSPAEEGVNLMHGRNVAGLEAKLSNINLARGLPDAFALAAAAQEAQTVAQTFADQRARLLDGLADLRAGLRQRAAADGTAVIAANPQLQADLKSLVALMRSTVDGSDPKAPRLDLTHIPALNLDTMQMNRNNAYVRGVTGDAASLKKQLQQLVNRVAQAQPQDLEPVRREAMALVDATNAQLKEHLGNVGIVRVEALENGRAFLASIEANLGSRIGSLASQASQAVAVLKAQAQAEPERLLVFENAWRESVAAISHDLRGLLDTLRTLVDGALGKWFSPLGDAGTLRVRVLGVIEPVIAELADYLDRWLASLPSFEQQLPAFDALGSELKALLDPTIAQALLAELNTVFAAMVKNLGGWDAALQSVRDEFDKACAQLQSQLLGATLGQIASELNAYADSLESTVKIATDTIVAAVAGSVSKIAGEMGRLQGAFDALSQYQSTIEDSLNQIDAAANGTVGELEQVVVAQVAIAEAHIAAGTRQLEEWARGQIEPALDIGKHNVNAALETVRILAQGPVTEGLQVTREQVGYYFDKALDAVALTPVSAMFNDLGEEALNALSASVPFKSIYDRLQPSIAGLAVRDLFPDFCGIKLTYLLPDLDVPLDDTQRFDWLTIQHGFDKERLSAWARVSIDKRFDENATLFDLGPVKLRLLKPLFRAASDLMVEDGRQRNMTSGRLESDFELSLNDKPMVTLADGVLAFDERGHLDFQFDSNKLVLAPELEFVQQALQKMLPQIDGLVLTPQLPAGIQADLTLPLPDIGTGAFTLTGITLTSRFGLLIGDGFEIRSGLWLSKPERPFGLAVLFLGGGGWFGIEASYKPPSKFVTRVSIGISAGAFVAVNFGFAAGSAGILFTAGVDFYRDWQTGNGTTAVTIGILVWGEFSILGIASAGVRLTLTVTYTDGAMRGDGVLTASIRICWCYTLRVNRAVTKQFSGGSAKRSSAALRGVVSERVRALGANVGAVAGTAAPPDIAKAVKNYFETLAI
ncbi:hypothetical protein [Paraburkholderia graminis]|uniref:Uncharacterized protein n=1 Tax=Paraburkholderia graminis TaxID=60548 RepID=A0ABD5CB59_9BURK|nr:hypothetical protein [Paraburkholderia graminis]MDR6202508.1 hypothetical protein [Paraburkholderia graminis]